MMFMREDGEMGMCRICGKNFGLMGGGSEPYTGHNLQVCNSCGEVLKKIDKVKNEDTQEVKDLFVSVMSMTDDADVKQILTDYSKSVISDSEKLVAITNESKEKAERAQNIEENFYDLEKAFKVTTGYIVPLNLGGADRLENIQIACFSCNQLKKNILPEDFLNRVTNVFMYQMEKKCRHNLQWKCIKRLLKTLG